MSPLGAGADEDGGSGSGKNKDDSHHVLPGNLHALPGIRMAGHLRELQSPLRDLRGQGPDAGAALLPEDGYVKYHTELATWIEFPQDITAEDVDALVATAEHYLAATGGIPEIGRYIREGLLCITVAGMSEEVQIIEARQLDPGYPREMIEAALADAGMLEE